MCVTAMRVHTEKEMLQQNALLALAAITWSSKEIQASAREAGADRCCSRRVGGVVGAEGRGWTGDVGVCVYFWDFVYVLALSVYRMHAIHTRTAHAHAHVHTHTRKRAQMHAHALTRTQKHRQVQLCMKKFETNSTIQQQGNIILKKLAGS